MRTTVELPDDLFRQAKARAEAKDPTRRLSPETVAAAEEQLLDEESAAHSRLRGH